MLRLILLLVVFTPAAALSQSDSLLAAQYLADVQARLESNQSDKALDAHRKALDIYKKNDRLDQWLESYIPVAYTWADALLQPFIAQDYLDAALKGAWRSPKNAREWEQLARIHLNKGHLYQWYTFDYPNAAKHYEESFNLFVNQLGEKNDKIAAYIYHQLGNLYTRRGDYARAENLLRRGIEYGKKNHKPEIGKYGDLAIVLIDVGKNREALDVIREGLAVSNAEKDALITARLSEARALLNLGDVRQSRASVDKVPALIARLEGAEDEIAYYKAGYHAMSGALQDSLGNYSAAATHYRMAIEFETAAQGTPFCREVGKAHNSLANFYLRNRQPTQALLEFQEVLKCVIKGFQPKSVDENPPFNAFTAENTIIEGLIGKARAFQIQNKPERALACYELIPHVEARLRATHAYESSSLLALNESRQRFDKAITLAWQLYEYSNHDRQYAERAFLLSEKARGILLLQSLVRAQADFGLPATVRKRENDLRVKMSWYDHEIAGEKEKGAEGDIARLKQLEKELFDLKQDQEQFKTFLRDSFPEYARLSEEISFPDAAEVATLLRTDQAMVSYYLTESDAYVFYFDASGMFNWRKAVLPEGFREMVQGFAGYLYKGDENDKTGRLQFLRVASLLYDVLLAPELRAAAPAIRSLLIVPDGALVIIPFETLLRQSADTNWRKLPWLLRDYNIGYAYSATLLQTQQQISLRHRKETKPVHTFGGFAPAYPGKAGNTRDNPMPDYPLPDIKSTQDELRNVFGLTGGKAYFKDDASEKQFRSIAADCRMLLLAMHGFANDEHPELSCLMFGIPTKDTSEHNNVLYASELQIMQLHADLVVLSACHTGSGKLQKGEGVYSLARAFAAAGVPCTVMSLWRLHENPAPQLVEAFFAQMKAGKTKDEALRLAKLAFLDDDKNGEMLHPFYWASLMATGDMCVLELPSGYSLPPWLIAAGTVPLLFLLFQFRRRKRIIQI